MKQLEINEMMEIQGSYGIENGLCDAGMAASGFFLGLAVTATTGGVGAVAFTIGWGAFSGWVCSHVG